MAEELVIKVRTQDEASAAIERLKKHIEDLDGAAKGAGESASGFGLKTAAITAGVGAAAVAVGGLVAAFGAVDAAVNAAMAGISRGGFFDDLSRKIGVSVENLSRLEVAATASGVSMEGMATGLKFLSRNMVEAAQGGAAQSAAFASIGLAVTDAAGRIRDTNEVLLEAVDVFSRMAPGAQKTALAMEIFGKVGSELLPFLDAGREGLLRFQEINDKLGLTLSTQTAASLDSVSDSFDIFGKVSEGISQQFAVGLAPALEEVTNGLVDLVAEIGIGDGTIKSFGATVGDAILSGFEKAKGALEDLKEIFTTLSFDDAMAVMQTRLDAALQSAFESAIWAAARAAKSVFLTAVDWVFGSVDIAAIAATKNERLIRDQLGSLEQELRTRLGAGATSDSDFVRTAAQHDAAVRQLVAGIDTLKGRLSDLGGQQVVAAQQAILHGNAMEDAGVAANLEALGLGKSSEAFRFYEVAGVAAVATTKQNTEAKKEHQSAAAKETESLLKSAQALAAKTAVTQAETNAMLLGLEAGDSYAEIMGDVARAALEVEAAQKLQEGASLASVEAWLKEAEAAQESADAKKAAQAAVDYAKETADLTAQVEVWRQVKDGVLTTAQAYHELAVQAEMAKTKVDRATADAVVTAREKAQNEIDAIKKATEEVADTTTDALTQIDDAFSAVLDGLISGTLQFSDIWKSMAASMVKDFAQSVGGVRGLFDGIGNLFKGGTSTGAGYEGFFDKNGNQISGGEYFLNLIGGGTSRFQTQVKDQWGNVQYGADGKPLTETNYGAIAGSAISGGATAYATFRPTEDSDLQGLIAKGTESGVLSAANGIGQIFGTVAGAVLSVYLGPAGGFIGGILGSGLSSLIVGSIDRNTFLKGDYKGFMGAGQDAFDLSKLSSHLIAGLPLGPFVAKTSQILFDAILNLPSLGLALRKGGESVLDNSETFKAAQGRWGDITVRSGGPEAVYRNNLTGGDTARARGFSQGQVDLTQGATAAIFGQISEGEMAEDAGRLGEAMGNIMAEFLSRGLEDGVDFEPMFDLLRQFAHEAGIDLFTSMKSLDDVMNDSMAAATTWGKLDPMAAATQGARAYAEALVGTTAVFEGDFPAGVNLTAIALRNMEKDGVNAFGEMDDAAKDTLRNLSDDTELTMDVVAKLVEQGFTIDTEAFQRQVEAIAGSASFIGQNIGAVFTGPSVFAGIEAMGEALRAQLKDAIATKATEQLFDKTRIAESFAPVYEVLAKLNEGDFDLTDAVGAESFKNQMVLAIANGKASLQEYIPQLRAIRDAAEEVDKAIEEALAPSSEEAFWANIAETLEANKDAVKEMAGDMFEVAVQAERAGEGLSAQATRDAMQRQVDQGIYTATQMGVETAAGESPEAERLARLTTEFQFKVAAALKDGVISGEEQADLTMLKAKLTNAGNAFADVVSSGTAGLADLFRVDRLKEAITEAKEALKGSVGSAAGSMFDVIKEGGSTAEGVKAFGESFRASVRDNVLQGLQEALVQSVVMEGALGTLMGQMKQAVSVALSDGFIDADEQAFIDGLAKGIGSATDSALKQLEPTLNTLGGIAQTVAGNTDKAEVKLDDLDRNARDASDEVDEMARRAARNLEQIGEAVPEGSADAIKDGISKLAVAVESDGATDDIKDGIAAMAGAIGATGSGGVPDDIKAGIGAMAGALGAQASGGAPDDIKAGIGKMTEALGTQGAGSGMADAVVAVTDALTAGEAGAGLQGAIEDAAGAMLGSDGLVTSAEQAAGALKDALGEATLNAAGALQDKLIDGLGGAREGLDVFAGVLRDFRLPTWNPETQEWLYREHGGPVGAGQLAVVGEAGPELMIAHPGGGATIIPLKGVPMMASGGTVGASSAAPLSLTMSPLASSAERAAAALESLGESSSKAASSMDEAATASVRPHPPNRPTGPGQGKPDWPDYVPITEKALEDDDRARIEETWRSVTKSLDDAFSNKTFVEQILNGDIAGNQRLDQLVTELKLSKENPELLKALGELQRSGLSGATTVNDARYYAKMLEEIGTSDFVKFLHDKRTNAELYQESIEQVVPGGGPLPPVDYLEYSDEVKAFMEEYGNIDLRGKEGGPEDVGPLDFKTRADDSLEKWLDPEKIESVITLSLDGAIEAFAKGGSVEELHSAINESINSAMYDGLMQGLIDSLNVGDAQSILNAAVSDAMSDGTIDAAESEELKALAEQVKADLEAGVLEMEDAFDIVAEAFGESMDPVGDYLVDTFGERFKQIAEEFGIELGKDTYENLRAGAQAGASALGGALGAVLNDPSKLTMENLTTALKSEIYQSVSSGLIDAFIQSAVVQGALAVPLGIIQASFAAVAAGQMNAAEANVVIAEQVSDILSIINGPEFAAMMQPVLDGLKQLAQDLGQTGQAVEETVPPFQDAAQAAEDACTGECDLEYKLAVAQTGIGNLTEGGGAGVFGIEYYEPQRKFARGGFVRGSARGVPGIFGEAGDEIVMPLDGAEAQAALAAAAAGFAIAAGGSGGSAAAAADASAALEARVAEMSAAVRDQVTTLREENEKLREALAATVGELAGRPVVVEVDGQPIATAVVGALERSTRAGRSRLDRTR